jgi:dihydroxy-acid dehydratase
VRDVSGPIGLVTNGDQIRIDVNTNSIDLLVSEEELAERATRLKPFTPWYTTGVLEKSARLVQGAEKGAVTSA